MLKRIGAFMRPRRSSGSGGGPAIPTTGLQAWFKADAGTFTDTGRTTPASTNGANVLGWADQSGNGNHLSAVSATPTLKTNAQNGQPAVLFAMSQTAGFMDFASDLAFGNDMEAFIVHKSTNVFGNVVLGNVASASDFWFFHDSCVLSPNTGSSATEVTNTLNTWFIGNCWLGGGQAHVNLNNGAGSTVSNSNGITWTGIVYDSGFTNHRVTGEIAEIIIYNRKLTALERSEVQTYLNTKYTIY